MSDDTFNDGVWQSAKSFGNHPNLLVRAELISTFRTYIRDHTDADADRDSTDAAWAQRLGIASGTFKGIMQGRINKISIDDIINLMKELGMTVTVTITEE